MYSSRFSIPAPEICSTFISAKMNSLMSWNLGLIFWNNRQVPVIGGAMEKQ